MNIPELDILAAICKDGFSSQRILSETTGHSLGAVNNALRELEREGMLDSLKQPTEKARDFEKSHIPKNAIILAAGTDMKMGTFSCETPKALMQTDGEPLIERVIKQLRSSGITEIHIVVGFMKERFEYLIDKYGVELTVNNEYSVKGNLFSMRCAGRYLSGTYIIPGDLWCRDVPFRSFEPYSWYMVSGSRDEKSNVRVNRRYELIRTKPVNSENRMIGIAYISPEDCGHLRENIERLCNMADSGGLFWEEALFDRDRMFISAKTAEDSCYVEINSSEQLASPSKPRDRLSADEIRLISDVMKEPQDKIKEIGMLKKGMTNRSFVFECSSGRYILRVPGEGTDMLINRAWEAETLGTVSGKGICCDTVYIDPVTGYKIMRFLDNVRVCDPDDVNDLTKCMKLLKSFHNMELKVGHSFDIFGQADYYTSLRNGKRSVYDDYETTRENVFSLKGFIESHTEKRVLTHIDAVPDNFLFEKTGDGTERLWLTDWEYAGMNDPHVDIAMFCIYSMYDRAGVDRLIDIYFENRCPEDTRTKIYCYISACGLLWSNWCEYKRMFGVEFGEYSLRQYRYAKEYYRIAKERIRDE